MLSGVNSQPLWATMNFQRVTVQMIVRSDEIDVVGRVHETDHSLKLTREIDVIVFGEIDEITVGLTQKDVDLLPEGSVVSHGWERDQYQVFGVEIFTEQVRKTFGTSIENGPNFYPQSLERLLKRPQTNFSQVKLVVTEWQASGGLRNFGIDAVRDRQIIAGH